MKLKLNQENLKAFIDKKDSKNLLPLIQRSHEELHNRTGAGREFTGWLDLPSRTKDSFLNELSALGDEVRQNSDCVVSIGIGGSYLGIRATSEFLTRDQRLPIYYAGNNLSAGYMDYLLKVLKDKRVSVVVISKSGTTTEPALAFRIIHQFMKGRYSSQEVKKRIICVTDKEKGALKKIAIKEGYKSFVIDDDVGGRYSVLTPVGLVPLAIAGIDIKGLIKGAREAQAQFSKASFDENLAYQYAANRFLLYKHGKVIEVLSSFYQRCAFVAEWWKQLAGESEGKSGKGIFPASLNFTGDLHSMGQLLQEGERNMFETFLTVEDTGYQVIIPKEEEDLDKFNCVAGKDLDFVNKKAYEATAFAHKTGGVPNMTIEIADYEAETLGQLFYFFEKAVAMTGYLMNVNPFDQPGVEAYKKKMFELLGKK